MILRRIDTKNDIVRVKWIGFGIQPVGDYRCILICVYQENVRETIECLNRYKEVAISEQRWETAVCYREETDRLTDRLKQQTKRRYVFELASYSASPAQRFKDFLAMYEHEKFDNYYNTFSMPHCFLSKPSSLSSDDFIAAFPDAKWHFGRQP